MSSMMDGSISDNIRELQVSKMKYCMHKDDIAISLGRPMYGTSVNMCNKKAYPSVISTMGGTNQLVQRWMAVHNFMVQNYTDTSSLKDRLMSCIAETPYQQVSAEFNDSAGHAHWRPVDTQIKNNMKRKIDNMLEFHFFGVSLGIAYAHQHSGDTVASVMVGGLKTILNGAFQVRFNLYTYTSLLVLYSG
jgi:hypothetical protein